MMSQQRYKTNGKHNGRWCNKILLDKGRISTDIHREFPGVYIEHTQWYESLVTSRSYIFLFQMADRSRYILEVTVTVRRLSHTPCIIYIKT